MKLGPGLINGSGVSDHQECGFEGQLRNLCPWRYLVVIARIWESGSPAVVTWDVLCLNGKRETIFILTFGSLRLPTFMLWTWAEEQLTLPRSRGISPEGLSKTVGGLLRVWFSKGFTCKGWPSGWSSSGCLLVSSQGWLRFVTHRSCLTKKRNKYMQGYSLCHTIIQL